jgi:hypothetical protein
MAVSTDLAACRTHERCCAARSGCSEYDGTVEGCLVSHTTLMQDPQTTFPNSISPYTYVLALPTCMSSPTCSLSAKMPLRILPAVDADAARAFEIEHLAYTAVDDRINSLMVSANRASLDQQTSRR